ncbi:MAG TPA: MFS transporter [Candidatus Saccharimonadales bacterium]|nr:MFS transporter [Candidatus Saccharimonadales bacterium]
MNSRRVALLFVLIIGVANLFADFTYEGGRSINGQFLGTLGASAIAVGFIAGLGELVGYGLRAIVGFFADRTGRYWLATISGYTINMIAVPLLALAGNWPIAAMLIVAERAGRAIRKPATETMLSYAGSRIGQGWVFGLNEFLDQTGAMLGPLMMSLVLLYHGDFRTGYRLLWVSAGLCITIVLIARYYFPKPRNLVRSDGLEIAGFSSSYWWYMIAAGCIATGFADFALIGYHFQQAHTISAATVPLYYAVAMGVGAIGALIFGRLFDRGSINTIFGSVFLSAGFAPLVFLGNGKLALGGMVLWGLGSASQESLLKSLVAGIVPSIRRATGFGLFDTGFGIAWFMGSWFMGYLYSKSITELVVFSVCLQLLSLPIFWLAYRRPVAL